MDPDIKISKVCTQSNDPFSFYDCFKISMLRISETNYYDVSSLNQTGYSG